MKNIKHRSTEWQIEQAKVESYEVVYYLDNLGSAQLTFIQILDLEVFKDDDGRYFFSTNDRTFMGQLRELRDKPLPSFTIDHYRDKLMKIPLRIRNKYLG